MTPSVISFWNPLTKGSLILKIKVKSAGLEAKKISLEATIFIGRNPRSNQCLRPSYMMGLGRFQAKNGGRKPYHTIFWVGGPKSQFGGRHFYWPRPEVKPMPQTISYDGPW